MRFLYEPVAVRRINGPFLPEAAVGDTPLGKPEKAEDGRAKSKYPDKDLPHTPRAPVWEEIQFDKENTR